MKIIKVLLSSRPKLLSEVIRNMIEHQADMQVVGEVLVKKAVILLLSAALLFTMITGCAWSNKAKGGAIGAGAGGVAGGVIGNQLGNTALGAIIGAAVGGTAGVLIGNEMDKRAEEMRAGYAGSKDRARRRRNQDHI